MRYFPQIVVPLLLFLIAILLGAILYLQYTRAPNEPVADSGNNQGRCTPWDPIETPDFSDEDGDMAGSPEHGRRERDSAVVEVDPRITQEPVRVPPESELKPDLKAIEAAEAKAEREKAEAQARLEAVLARGAVLEQEQDGKKLNSRVLWVVPPLAQMGAVTPEDVTGYFCGPIKELPATKAILATLAPSEVEATEKLSSTWVLVGRISPDRDTAAFDLAWKDLQRPPAVVTGLGQTVVANGKGWFAISFHPEQWSKDHRDGLRLRMAGWRLVGTDKNVTDLSSVRHELDRNHRDHKPVTLVVTPAPAVVLRLSVSPGVATQAPNRVWLEVFSRPKAYRPQMNEPALFIECDMPASGVVSFVLPDPRTFSSGNPRFAAAGDGWSSGTPQELSNWWTTKPDKRQEAPRFLLAKQSLVLQRASTELVQGLCLAAQRGPEAEPVRVESKQTGAVTWTYAGAFGLWVELTRGNWQQMLIVDPLYAPPIEFSVDYDAERPPSVKLAEGAGAPLGPWHITLPARDTFACYVYIEWETALQSMEMVLPKGTRSAKFEAVEGAPGVYLVPEFPLYQREIVVRGAEGSTKAERSLFNGSVPGLPESAMLTDPWGHPLPVIALKRK